MAATGDGGLEGGEPILNALNAQRVVQPTFQLASIQLHSPDDAYTNIHAPHETNFLYFH